MISCRNICARSSSRGAIRDGRRGAVIFAALACLIIVTAIVGAMLKNIVQVRRQLHAERDLRQTELLVQAGADRAAGKLGQDASYRGDRWDVPAEAIVGHGGGRVTSKVTPAADGNSWQVSVVAEYPLDHDFPIQRSQIFSISSAKLSQE